MAAVVPISRLHPAFLLSPLAVGAIAPDLEYFLRQAQVSRVSHTLPGILVFCVPAGLVALWLFHRLLARAVLALLPPVPRQALAERAAGPFPFWPARRLAHISLLIALGAFTHIAWDSCTHGYTWTVRHVRVLDAVVFTAAGVDVRVHKVLQHASSLAGIGLLAFWSLRWFRENAPATWPPYEPAAAARRRHAILAAIVAAAVAGAWIAGFFAVRGRSGIAALSAFLVRGAVGGLTGGFLALLLFAVTLAVNARRAEPSRASRHPS
jgi:hypothetical protein